MPAAKLQAWLRRSWGTEVVDGETRVVVHEPNLDAAHAHALGEYLLALTGGVRSGRLEVDLGSVSYLSDTCLGKFVAVDRQLRAGGGRLTLVGVSPEVYEVFEITHLNTVFDLREAA